MNWRINIKIAIFFLWLFAISSLCSEGLAQGSEIIVPGKGVAEFTIGDSYPDQPQESQKYGINLIPTSDKQRIAKIEITSSRYLLEGSWLRVMRNTKEDVLRFYGQPDRQHNPNELNYPYSGISYTVDEKSGIISKITIFKSISKKIFLQSPKRLMIYKDLYQKQKK